MAFVKDQQPEARSQLGRMDAGAGIGSDRYGTKVMTLVTEDARIDAKSSKDPAMPLVHQIPNRCDDQRRQASLGEDREGHLGLARTRGHNDDAVSCNRPSIEGLLLLGTERRQLIL